MNELVLIAARTALPAVIAAAGERLVSLSGILGGEHPQPAQFRISKRQDEKLPARKQGDRQSNRSPPRLSEAKSKHPIFSSAIPSR